MEVRTFRASSLQEALEQVRKSLGPDAAVLKTREVMRGRLGLFAKKIIEVEASSAVAPEIRSDHPLESNQKLGRQGAISLPAPSSRLQISESQANESPAIEAPHQVAVGSTSPINTAVANITPQRDSPQEPLDQIVQRQTSQQTTRLPSALFETLSELLDAGVDPAVAKQLVQAAAQHCTPEQLDDAWLVKGRMVQQVGADLRVSAPIEVHQGKQQIVALVGPTGVGKTTTLAKLATRFHFDQSCRVGFVTLDTFRPGAVDQLLQYAESLNAPLEVVSSADQFLPALQRLKACDLVLLDTAGRSPSDTEQISVLRSSLLAAQPTSVQLVVSATSSAGHVQAAMKQFAPLTPTGLVITKLDEAVGFGAWLSILRHTSLPISYLTQGQQVPQDLVVANRRRLASLLLGHANHHSSTVLSS